jgi:hypothetical protein
LVAGPVLAVPRGVETIDDESAVPSKEASLTVDGSPPALFLFPSIRFFLNTLPLPVGVSRCLLKDVDSLLLFPFGVFFPFEVFFPCGVFFGVLFAFEVFLVLAILPLPDLR